MDPITTSIVSAITAGVIAGAGESGKKLIVDAYAALKNAIKSKTGVGSDVVEALESVEKKPASKARQSVLAEEVTSAGLDKDPALLKLAQALGKALKEAGGNSYTATAGDNSVIVQGTGNAVATGGSVAVGGNVEGGIHLGGKKGSG